MPTPAWSPGTLYNPGNIVRRRTAAPAVQSAPDNPNFVSGGDDWDYASPWGIASSGAAPTFNGSPFSMELGGLFVGVAYFSNDNQVPVRPGQYINAHCYVNTVGQPEAGRMAASCVIFWYDASHAFISASEGGHVTRTVGMWVGAGVSGYAPPGAAFAAVGGRGQRNADAGTYGIYFGGFSWDYTYSEPPDGLVFQAVQSNAGFSGIDEPNWPTTPGDTVVDNEVTWEALIGPSITWEAAPILVSGSTEPDWGTVIGAAVPDNTIIWTATTGQVTDEKCPNTIPVAIAASKVFAGNDDIISFSATINPLDWSTRNDAGYLPFGLQTYGSTPVTALGLYRGNLVAFNAQSFQMWQVDQDPANMALLDAVPVGCVYPRSVQPLMNDLLFLSKVGVRGIGIAGASTTLQADGIGEPVDALVVPKIRAAEYEPIAINYPAGGQYWIVFGPEAFVCTINGAKNKSWSRYVFPYPITDWTIHEGDLYLRASPPNPDEDVDDLVWKFDGEQVDDDVVYPHAEFTSGGAPVVAPIPSFLQDSSATAASGELLFAVAAGFDPDTTENGLVVVTIALQSASALLGEPESVTLVTDGGETLPADFLASIGDADFGSTTQYLVVATARPTQAFTSATVEVSWAALPNGLAAKHTTTGFYNVDPASDDFSLGAVTGQTDVTSAGELLAVNGSAIFAADIQYTGGDYGANVRSVTSSTNYTMLGGSTTSARELGDGHYYRPGYRLFTASVDEQLQPVVNEDGEEFRPVIAFVLGS